MGGEDKREFSIEEFRQQFMRGTPKLARGRVAGASHQLGMNKTEAAYSNHLEYRRLAGEIMWWGFHLFRIPLANRSWYTPDFVVQLADQTLEVHEVKGWATEQHALLQLKWAAQAWPVMKFRRFTKNGAGWDEREF